MRTNEWTNDDDDDDRTIQIEATKYTSLANGFPHTGSLNVYIVFCIIYTAHKHLRRSLVSFARLPARLGLLTVSGVCAFLRVLGLCSLLLLLCYVFSF